MSKLLILGCDFVKWLLTTLASVILIWAGKKSQQLSNLEAWGLLKLLSVVKNNANVTHTHTQHALFKENLSDRVLYTKDSSNII